MIPETKPEFKVSHCRHGDNQYSLSIAVDDIHVDLSTHSYTHLPGHHVDVTFYNLGPEGVMDLAKLLADEARRQHEHGSTLS